MQPDVDAKLAAAGLQFLYPGQSPDLYVIYSIRTVEKEHATTTMEGYGWGDGPWVGYGWNETMAEGLPPVQTVTTETPQTLGILTLDIVERVKKSSFGAAANCFSGTTYSARPQTRSLYLSKHTSVLLDLIPLYSSG